MHVRAGTAAATAGRQQALCMHASPLLASLVPRPHLQHQLPHCAAEHALLCCLNRAISRQHEKVAAWQQPTGTWAHHHARAGTGRALLLRRDSWLAHVCASRCALSLLPPSLAAFRTC